ncbi:MAG: hypothetical protein EZS28_038656 [Streblomastix strix]|uniref:Uncharacterized protein n=1 Tax=Streblomastix strix TaxID=222440 RepID=A0A5J4U5F9_9EUKA|nr:MAG: hypothetical protein EZS28_038656 [Streblomastix strix]
MFYSSLLDVVVTVCVEVDYWERKKVDCDVELSIRDGDLFVYESEDCSDVADKEEYQELAKSSVLEESIDILYLYFYQLVSFSDSANQFQYGIDQGGCDCVQAIFAFIYFFIPDLSSKDSTDDDVGVA